ncbi:MAG TPA: glycosyltransferase family A protein [Candidatus Deferrimicrobiaceae bacterium]|nr:glycosyltransferase family A protein [Candidatus Deferrimicrobiaceae bacterium]
MQIDVVLLTKNSEHLLSRCLNSVYQNVPIKNLIVIDGYSTDRTQEILLRFNWKYGNVSIFQMHGSRAAARTEGIRRVSTDWFMFVDSDVLLCNGWFKKAHADMSEGVGVVWGLNVDVIPNIKNKRILTLQSIIARKAFNLRGGMHDTLILRKAVDGMRIPEHLHTYEDAYIVQYIASRGFKVAVGNDIYCLHYKPPSNWSLKNGLQQATGEVQNCLVYSHLYRYMLYYPVFFLYWCLQLPLNGFKLA